MATIGQPLTAPEAGWKRYDDVSVNGLAVFVGTWSKGKTDSGQYMNTLTYTQAKANGSITFKFYGSKFRLIAQMYPNRSTDSKVIIDGVEYIVNMNGANQYMIIVYEVLDLPLGYHTVVFKEGTNNQTTFAYDAIDIDKDGYLVHPLLNQVSSVADMQIGDCIPCRYTAVNGSVGAFSELGTCKEIPIPPDGGAYPDGNFYFIHTGYDHLGRMKLVADRNIQHSISWDTLNNAGYIFGNKVPTSMSYKIVTGTTGGVASASSERYSEYAATNAFNGARDDGYGWQSADYALPAWLQYKFNIPTRVDKYAIISRNNAKYLSQSPKDWTLQGSNDGSTWTVLDTRTNEIGWGQYETREYTLNNTNKYFYYRLVISATNESCAVQIDELEFYAVVQDDGSFNTFKTNYSIRLLSGGVSASDKDNEWDKLLLESDIDRSIWNLGQPSWVSTTLSGTLANRVLRGQDGYFTSLTSGTANTSTGFRPVLLVEFLNEPPVFDLNTDSEEFHKNSITIFGNITDKDNDQISYQIMLNNEVIEDWSNFINTPVEINYTISNELLILGNNKIVVNIIDTAGNTTRWEKTIPFVNNLPTIDLSVDKLSTFETDVNIVGQIIDPDNDGVSYRLKVNDQVLVDWTAFYTSPHSINIPIQHYYLHIGVNTLVVEYKDEYGDVLSWVGQVILKDIDSFYVDDECHNFSDSIKVGNGSIAYLKVANANANYGYIRTSNLILNIINGNFSSGVINVAPILTNWSSDSVTIESLPTIDVDNAIEFEINNATGTHEIIASQLLNKMIGRNVFGIAIYSDSFSLELDILGNTVEVDYQPTELILPENVYGNRVRIEWKPIIIRKIAAFEKIRIVRSTTPLFTTYEVIYETTDIHELVCEDRTVSEGTYYYRAEVFNINNPINGTIDYSETTESEFIQEDEFNGTDFVSSHVQIHSVPALQNRLLDFNTPDGYIYDSSKVEVVSGKLQLKDLSI